MGRMSKNRSALPALSDRTAGILMHLTSLPSTFGVGDLGPSAYAFLDFLEKAGQQWWQMLPINPAGMGNSPYQAYSAMAGSSLLVSPEGLFEDGLLTRADLDSVPTFPKKSVDYPLASRHKHRLLGVAFGNFLQKKRHDKDFEAFEREQADWLEDYTLYAALQQLQKGAPWTQWQEPMRRRHSRAIEETSKNLTEKVLFQKFVQFEFEKQWKRLKEAAVRKGIGLIGDLPIFVSLDSADVWSHPEIFRLNNQGMPDVVAGVPPDMFSKTGQRWGNPLYDWDSLKKQKYAWWVRRFERLFELFDVVRIDHFIGFHRFWEIPATEKTAVKGRYIPGPGAEFFKETLKQVPRAAFIAEDLGLVVPEVTALRQQFHFPGMSVLQFAFSGEPAKNPYLPYKLVPETVVYTGTHDNDTTEGWFEHGASEKERKSLRAYLNQSQGPVHWEMVRLAYASVANTAMIPLQDLLGLGSEARMNYPGKTEGNWQWRLDPSISMNQMAVDLQKLAEIYGRTGPTPN
jgi:4-alpha-glucanotransferase